MSRFSITKEAFKALAQKFALSDIAPSEDLIPLYETTDHNLETGRFRIKVLGGGCSGFKYQFSIDQTVSEIDIIFKPNNMHVEIIIDKHSIPLLEGSNLHYISELSSEYFTINNPNAKSNCGCGSSFST